MLRTQPTLIPRSSTCSVSMRGTCRAPTLCIYDLPTELLVHILAYVTAGSTLPNNCMLTCKLFAALAAEVQYVRLTYINQHVAAGSLTWQLISNEHTQTASNTSSALFSLAAIDSLSLGQRDVSSHSINEDMLSTVPPAPVQSAPSNSLFHSLASVFKRSNKTPHASPVLSPMISNACAYEILHTAPTLHAHNTVVVNDTVYVYAGSMKQFDIRGSNELYSYNIQSKVWKRMLCTNKPAARTFAPIVYDREQHSLLTFGGQDRDTSGKWTFYNTVHRYDIQHNQWLTQLTTSLQTPCARVGHRMALLPDSNNFILFGGCYCTDIANQNVAFTPPTYTYLNDCWSFDMASMQWTQHQLTGDVPTSRHSYEWCVLPYTDNHNRMTPYLFLYGGNSNVYSSSNLSDTYLINVHTMHCTRVTLHCYVSHYDAEHQHTHNTVRTDLPSGRWAANMNVLGDYVLLYGGYRSQHTPSDFSLKHIYTLNWRHMVQRLTSQGRDNNDSCLSYWYRRTVRNHIVARTFSSSFVVDNSRIMLYGGASKGIPMNEIVQLM